MPKESKTENKMSSNPRKVLEFSGNLFAPAVILSLFLILTSYIIDLCFSDSNISALGEKTAISSVLFGTGNLILKYSYIFISAGIIIAKSSKSGFPAAIVGALLVSNGNTFLNISGSLPGISGVFGSVIAGYSAVFFSKACKKALNKFKISTEIAKMIQYILPIIFNIIAILSLNTMSSYINLVSTSFIATLAESKSIIFPVVIGIFTIADGGGPLNLSAYVFASTSLIAKEVQVMAAVTSASMVPALSCALFSYIYGERMKKHEIRFAYASVLTGLAGLPQASYYFYITKGVRVLIPCIAGSAVTSLLSVVLGCGSSAVSGGVLPYSLINKHLYLGLSITLGVLISTAFMALLIKENKEEKQTKPNTSTQRNTINA